MVSKESYEDIVTTKKSLTKDMQPAKTNTKLTDQTRETKIIEDFRKVALTDSMGKFKLILDDSRFYGSVDIGDVSFTNFVDKCNSVMKSHFQHIFKYFNEFKYETDLPLTLSDNEESHFLFNLNNTDNAIQNQLKKVRYTKVCSRYEIPEEEFEQLMKYEFRLKPNREATSIRAIVLKNGNVLKVQFFDPHHLLATNTSRATRQYRFIKDKLSGNYSSNKSCIFSAYIEHERKSNE